MYWYTVFYTNNFRVYRDPAQQKFVFLPWGMDMSMKPYRDSGKPHIMALELAHQYDEAAAPVTSGLIFQRCLSSATCRSQYIDVVKSTAEAYEKANLEALAKHYHEQIAESVAADPRKEYTVEQIETAYQSLLKVVRERPEALRKSLQ